MQLKDGYNQSQGLDGEYRFLTVQEAKALCIGKQVPCIDNSGAVRLARVLSIKTWKRSPGCIVSLKYGLRSYFTVGDKDMAESDEMPVLLKAI